MVSRPFATATAHGIHLLAFIRSSLIYRLTVYNKHVIQSFRDDETEKVWNEQFSKKFQSIARTALRKLVQLNRATRWQDLAAVPGNHLETLYGDRDGQNSIRINAQYRICFRWEESSGDAYEVEIVDYH